MKVLAPQNRRLRKQLHAVASSGYFDLALLHDIREKLGSDAPKSLRYYLSSLYLQVGDCSSATAVLKYCGRASNEMKKYCRVLIHCRQQGLPVPRLSRSEHLCLDYLERVVNPYDGLLICGNAPSETKIDCPQSWCRIYFNDYRKNPAIDDLATIHVVTPSWDKLNAEPSVYLCITGNDIFYRRSNVWKRFMACQSFESIFTVPKAQWSDLMTNLGSSPSAGLLILGYVEDLFAKGLIDVDMPVMVAGYSKGKNGANHSYDSVPASSRHNWAAEKVAFGERLGKLQAHCTNLIVKT